MPDAALIRITLLDLDPAPWREVEVPLAMTLEGLHRAIQAAFLWQEAHLWEFEIEGRRYGPDPEPADMFGERVYKGSGMRLARLRELAIMDFLYTYDMGDDWRHRVQILETRDLGAPLPRLAGGRWRAPPEDVGGAPGFAEFRAVLADPAHPEHAELLDWHGGPFEPADIGEPTIRARLAAIARTRGRRR